MARRGRRAAGPCWRIALAVPVPDAARIDIARCVEAGRPPLPALGWPRDPAWRQALAPDPAAELATEEAPACAVRELGAGTAGDAIEAQADAPAGRRIAGWTRASAPLVAAALQVYWTHLALAAARPACSAPARTRTTSCARAAAAAPTASITRIGGVAGQRYLHCSLCGTEWHLRAQCSASNCSNTHRTSATSPSRHDATPTRVKAETCDDCGHYLKIYMTRRDPMSTPWPTIWPP